MSSPALRHVRANSGITFRPDANTVLWLPGQDDPQSSTIRDRSGFGNDGAITGALWVRNSKGLWGLDFDGADDIVDLGSAASLDNIWDGGAATECWVDADSDGEMDAGDIFEKSAWFWHVDGEAVGKVRLRMSVAFDGASGGNWRSTTTQLTIGIPHHCLVTYDSDNVANNPLFYVDGVSVAVTEVTTPVGTRVSDGASNLFLGNRSDGARTFDGTLYLARMYNAIPPVGTAAIHYRQERGLFGV